MRGDCLLNSVLLLVGLGEKRAMWLSGGDGSMQLGGRGQQSGEWPAGAACIPATILLLIITDLLLPTPASTPAAAPAAVPLPQETLRTMFEITEEAALDPLPSRAASPYGSLLRWVGRAGWVN